MIFPRTISDAQPWKAAAWLVWSLVFAGIGYATGHPIPAAFMVFMSGMWLEDFSARSRFKDLAKRHSFTVCEYKR